MSDELTVKLTNRLDQLEGLAARIDAFCAMHQLSENITYALNLVLDEVLTNVISYGYTGTREHDIEVRLGLERGVLRAEIEDDGRAFNPLEVPPPVLDGPIEERRIGGLGLHIVRSMMDSVEYQRKAGHNVLTLTKRVV